MVEPLVRWFEENQRVLPWRTSYDPYQVWVSEVMLQQTQVETALPYFERFIRQFPTVDSLANADEQHVLTLWAGLGYYRRAKHLLAAAKSVAEKHGGEIPSDYDALIALPGVGQYMAGAILSIAFNRPFPVVDGNVRRVLCRIHGWEDDSPKALWDAAGDLVRQSEPRLINQAVMELGAKVCSFKAPRCLICPVQRSCKAFALGLQDKIPPVKKRKPSVHVHLFAVVYRRGNEYLMKPSDGLWEFPMFGELPAGESLKKVGQCRHTITHHRLDVSVYTGMVLAEGYVWKDVTAVPTSSLTNKILASAYPSS